MKNVKYHIAYYNGDAAYEPAEGGYYVPELYVGYVSDKTYKKRHALREFRKAVTAFTEEYGEPWFVNAFRAHWHTGKYIGDDFEIRITAIPELHERIYAGYR